MLAPPDPDAQSKQMKKEIEQEKRELMKIPLDPLPERELCEYEKLREKNIKEREAIMEKFGFFNDLNSERY